MIFKTGSAWLGIKKCQVASGHWVPIGPWPSGNQSHFVFEHILKPWTFEIEKESLLSKCQSKIAVIFGTKWFLLPLVLEPCQASGVFVGMNTTPRSDQRMTMGNDGASNGGLIACALPVICGIPNPSLWARTIRTNLRRCWIARPCLMGRFTRAGAPLRIT